MQFQAQEESLPSNFLSKRACTLKRLGMVNIENAHRKPAGKSQNARRSNATSRRHVDRVADTERTAWRTAEPWRETWRKVDGFPLEQMYISHVNQACQRVPGTGEEMALQA